jgi:hypothetical protein
MTALRSAFAISVLVLATGGSALAEAPWSTPINLGPGASSARRLAIAASLSARTSTNGQCVCRRLGAESRGREHVDASAPAPHTPRPPFPEGEHDEEAVPARAPSPWPQCSFGGPGVAVTDLGNEEFAA